MRLVELYVPSFLKERVIKLKHGVLSIIARDGLYTAASFRHMMLTRDGRNSTRENCS
jgi:hypothetical protein